MNEELFSQIRNKLVQSGRFTDVSLTCDVPFGEDHAVPLRLRLSEREDAAPLNVTLPEHEQAMCRLAQWLSNWSKSDVDLQLSVRIALQDMKELGLDKFVDHSEIKVKNFDPIRALGLAGTRSFRLSYTTGRSSGSAVKGGSSPGVNSIRSAPVMLAEARAGWPSTKTSPCLIQDCSRERLYSGCFSWR